MAEFVNTEPMTASEHEAALEALAIALDDTGCGVLTIRNADELGVGLSVWLSADRARSLIARYLPQD